MPKRLWTYLNYKDVLRDRLAQLKFRGARQALAQSMDCQQTYLSRVLNSDAEISMEQAEKACRHFQLSELETSYFLCLVSYNRAGTKTLTAHWKKELERLRRESTDLEKNQNLGKSLDEVTAQMYYQSWMPSAVHVASGIGGLDTVEDIAKHLGLSVAQTSRCVQMLINANLVASTPDGLDVGKRQLHLPKNSPHITQQHSNWKIKALDALSSPDPEHLHYTSVIGVSHAGWLNLRAILSECILAMRSAIRDERDELVGAYSIDLFKISGHTKENL